MYYVILIIAAVLSFIVGRMTVKNSGGTNRTFAPKRGEELSGLREEAREALAERTENRKEKILYILQNVATHQEELEACGVEDIKKGITTRNVEKLLDVSNTTARKYLNELEAENKIRQVGTTGRDVYYTLF